MNAVRHYSETIPLGKTIPFLAEEGWRASLVEAGAPGAKREPDRAKPQYANAIGWSSRCAPSVRLHHRMLVPVERGHRPIGSDPYRFARHRAACDRKAKNAAGYSIPTRRRSKAAG